MKIPTTHDDPSMLLGSLVTLGGAIFAALVVFGVLTEEQAAALGAVASTLLPLVVAVLIRRYAWAPATVEDESRREFRRGYNVALGETSDLP